MRRLITAVTCLAAAVLLAASSGCVHCHEFPPGTKLAQAPGAPGAFQARPQGGGPESRPSN
jgi:hypothetical protein